ncbi:MAG: hypothetical protein ACLGHY_05855, partial [Gammaproteobacteria bacterium]
MAFAISAAAAIPGTRAASLSGEGALSGAGAAEEAICAAGVPALARLSLRDIRKVYPGVVANDGIDLDVMPGEIHAVLGENSAGK